jgi:hypothetical protein
MYKGFVKTSSLALLASAASVGLMLNTQARATMLSPGGTPVATPGAVTFAGLTLLLGADETVPFTGIDVFNNVVFSGNLESRVYKEAGGTLDFAYQATADLGQPDSIQTITTINFAHFTTDVDYIASTGIVTYSKARRLSPLSGETLSFNFTPALNQIAPGDTTDWILVKTNALTYDNNGDTSFIDGGTGDAQSYEPVPEPASLSLLILGSGALLSRRRSRSRR